MQIGESFVGEGVDAAHVNTVLGRREGPVGTAWAVALATPSAGHAPFLAVARPGVPAVPPTLFVNKAAIAGDRHGELTWGAAQAGVASGVALALEEGVIDVHSAPDLVLIVAVWVNPEAASAEAVFENNGAATLEALRNGAAGRPSPDDFLEAAKRPFNAYFRA